MYSPADYDKQREHAFTFYKTINRVFSPVFNQKINFTAEGFNHIIFKGPRSERERPSQVLRFKLLPLAQKLLKISTTYQEFEETLKQVEIKSYKKKISISKAVRYWGIIAIIDDRKIKVIIRKIGDNGAPHFWSIVPAWTTNRYRDTKFFTTMKGNPEED